MVFHYFTKGATFILTFLLYITLVLRTRALHTFVYDTAGAVVDVEDDDDAKEFIDNYIEEILLIVTYTIVSVSVILVEHAFRVAVDKKRHKGKILKRRYINIFRCEDLKSCVEKKTIIDNTSASDALKLKEVAKLVKLKRK